MTDRSRNVLPLESGRTAVIIERARGRRNHSAPMPAEVLAGGLPTARDASRRPGPTPLKPRPVRAITRGTTLDPAMLKLIDRATFGYSRSTYDEAAAMGYEAYVESQLNPDSIDDSELDDRLANYDTLSMTTQEIHDRYREMPGVPVRQLIETTLLRAILSKRQLFERMVQFWTDHFNIDIQDGPVYLLKTADDRDVIRQHALGTFPDLLNASARSAAMLYYLDNYANVVGHAQENYARELMELHTLGVDNGYTQADVEEVARCLTGWTFQFRADLANSPLGEFTFNPRLHDEGAKLVLRTSIPAGGGESDGQTVLDILAYHPNTARFISRKLCTRFLGYDPPEDVVETVKQTYLDTGGDIRSMLGVIFHPSVMLYLSTPKFRRPFHLMVAALRATEASVASPRFLSNHLATMGHIPFYWSPPDGYPDSLEAWGSSVLPRWQFASALFGGDIPAVSMDLEGAMEAAGGVGEGTQAAAINRVLTGGQLPAAEVDAIQQFYDEYASSDVDVVGDAFGLAAAMPRFQSY